MEKDNIELPSPPTEVEEKINKVFNNKYFVNMNIMEKAIKDTMFGDDEDDETNK